MKITLKQQRLGTMFTESFFSYGFPVLTGSNRNGDAFRTGRQVRKSIQFALMYGMDKK